MISRLSFLDEFATHTLAHAVVVLCARLTLLVLERAAAKSRARKISPSDLQLDVKVPFRFVAYGDTRFHDPKDTEAANPPVRVALVQAIAEANPGVYLLYGRHRL